MSDDYIDFQGSHINKFYKEHIKVTLDDFYNKNYPVGNYEIDNDGEIWVGEITHIGKSENELHLKLDGSFYYDDNLLKGFFNVIFYFGKKADKYSKTYTIDYMEGERYHFYDNKYVYIQEEKFFEREIKPSVYILNIREETSYSPTKKTITIGSDLIKNKLNKYIINDLSELIIKHILPYDLALYAVDNIGIIYRY